MNSPETLIEQTTRSQRHQIFLADRLSMTETTKSASLSILCRRATELLAQLIYFFIWRVELILKMYFFSSINKQSFQICNVYIWPIEREEHKSDSSSGANAQLLKSKIYEIHERILEHNDFSYEFSSTSLLSLRILVGSLFCLKFLIIIILYYNQWDYKQTNT